MDAGQGGLFRFPVSIRDLPRFHAVHSRVQTVLELAHAAQALRHADKSTGAGKASQLLPVPGFRGCDYFAYRIAAIAHNDWRT